MARRHRQEAGHHARSQWEDNIKFWEVLHETIDAEPAYRGYRNDYGELAALGIEKGKPFTPDARMKAHPRAGGADRQRADARAVLRRPPARPHRLEGPPVGMGGLRFEDGDFNTPTYADTRRAREVVLPGDRRLAGDVPPRRAGAGSLYWLGLRDKRRAPISTAARRYKLTVPLPVPGKLFWSVTVYDAETRRRSRPTRTRRRCARCSSSRTSAATAVELYFGPNAAAGSGRPVDQDDPRQRLVRLLPHLRAGARPPSTELEAGRLRGSAVSPQLHRTTADRTGHRHGCHCLPGAISHHMMETSSDVAPHA